MKALAFFFAVLLMSGCATQRTPVQQGFEAVKSVVSGGAESTPQAYAAALQGYQETSGFACSQPTYAAYFRRNNLAGAGAEPCRDKVPLRVQVQNDGAHVVWLDPARVRSIHLLFASKSPSMASQFGHVALRLVVCPAPDSTDDACDMNLSEHLVLGFQAHIDDYSLNTLKALQGNYRAYLFASRFMDTYQQYAIGEFRELYSLPLRLQPAQRDELVRDLADIHWRYAGDYNFFIRNCATLLQNALAISWPEFANDPVMGKTYLRPDKMFAALQTSPLADGLQLSSLEAAERGGFYFSSTRSFYDAAVRDVRQNLPEPGFSSLEQYVGIAPEQRRLTLEEPRVAAVLSNTPHTREAQLMLEEYAVLHSERLLMIEAAKYFEQQQFLARSATLTAPLDEEHRQLVEQCLLQPMRQRAQPPRRLTGIPLAADGFSDVHEPSPLCTSIEGRRQLADTITAIEDKQSLQWQRLNLITQYRAASIENAAYIRQLH